MPRLEGFKSLQDNLKKMEQEAAKQDRTSVQVGYTQKYALIVHETVGHTYKTGGPKYLETPARMFHNQIAQTVRKAYKKTKDFGKSLVLGGLRLQRESQKVTPLDTGALRASAYTALEEEVDSVSKAAFDKSEAIRKSAGK